MLNKISGGGSLLRTWVAQDLKQRSAMRTRKRGGDHAPIHAFAGACLLTAALLLPHGHLRPVLSGMGLAGLIQWTWRSRHKDKEPDE